MVKQAAHDSLDECSSHSGLSALSKEGLYIKKIEQLMNLSLTLFMIGILEFVLKKLNITNLFKNKLLLIYMNIFKNSFVFGGFLTKSDIFMRSINIILEFLIFFLSVYTFYPKSSMSLYILYFIMFTCISITNNSFLQFIFIAFSLSLLFFIYINFINKEFYLKYPLVYKILEFILIVIILTTFFILIHNFFYFIKLYFKNKIAELLNNDNNNNSNNNNNNNNNNHNNISIKKKRQEKKVKEVEEVEEVEEEKDENVEKKVGFRNDKVLVPFRGGYIEAEVAKKKPVAQRSKEYRNKNRETINRRRTQRRREKRQRS